MKRLFAVLPFVATLLGILAYFNQKLIFSAFSFGCIFPFLSILYGLKRDFQYNLNDKTIYFIGVIGAFSDAVLFVFWGEVGQIFQIFLTLILYWLYISIFIREGVLLKKIKKIDILTISLIILFTISITIIFVIQNLSDSLFFLTLFFVISLIILLVLGSFYFSIIKSYLVLGGVFVILIKDTFYAFYFYTYHQPFLFVLNCFLNVIGYYLLTIGIAKEQNLKEKIS